MRRLICHGSTEVDLVTLTRQLQEIESEVAYHPFELLSGLEPIRELTRMVRSASGGPRWFVKLTTNEITRSFTLSTVEGPDNFQMRLSDRLLNG